MAENFSDNSRGLAYFLNVAGVGFDAHVVARIRDKRWGALAYLAALPASFATYRALEVSVAYDAQSFTSRVFVAFAAIGAYCGGGMYIAPDAITADGLLDVVIIENISRWELALNIRRLFDGSIKRYPKLRSFRTHWLSQKLQQPAVGSRRYRNRRPASRT
ncbi:MAG: diacylglycerol/lipid kinase family protein [Burkholderiales bacterium]